MFNSIKSNKIYANGITATQLAILLIATMISFPASATNKTTQENDIDTLLRQTIEHHSLKGVMQDETDYVSIKSPAAKLGMELFFSKELSGDRDVSCATCHHPLLGGGDGLSQSIGVAAVKPNHLGPGRIHTLEKRGNYNKGSPVGRNAPTTFNALLYKKALMHDGRLEKKFDKDGKYLGIYVPENDANETITGELKREGSLIELQARLPVIDREEMLGFEFGFGMQEHEIRRLLAKRFNTPEWKDKFEEVFGAKVITFELIAKAIAAYENSQLFIDNPWFEYLNGNTNAVSNPAKMGALLFYTEREKGGAGCYTCHSGNTLTDEGYHILATPQIGEGRGIGPDGDDDFGRYRITYDINERYAFRTPSLLNIAETAPYSHAGAYATLEEVVKHHINPMQAFKEYDFTLKNMDSSIAKDKETADKAYMFSTIHMMDFSRKNSKTKQFPIELGNKEVGFLVEFLKALTDRCVSDEQCIAEWIPENDESITQHQVPGMAKSPNI